MPAVDVSMFHSQSSGPKPLVGGPVRHRRRWPQIVANQVEVVDGLCRGDRPDCGLRAKTENFCWMNDDPFFALDEHTKRLGQIVACHQVVAITEREVFAVRFPRCGISARARVSCRMC